MSDRTFLDTTVLVYTISHDDPRASVARNLLASGATINVQVLNEFVAVARRKIKMPWAELRETLGAIRSFCGPTAPLTSEIHNEGLLIAERYGYRIYDALIIAAALDEDCDVLYSEDMQDGQRINSLTIRNPFAVRTH